MQHPFAATSFGHTRIAWVLVLFLLFIKYLIHFSNTFRPLCDLLALWLLYKQCYLPHSLKCGHFILNEIYIGVVTLKVQCLEKCGGSYGIQSIN
jgi:hypothetical protein